MSGKIIYIIPAREGSKGFPHKNRLLIENTVKEARKITWDGNIYITTDDPVIKEKYNGLVRIIDRPPELAQDDTSMKDVLLHAVSEIKPSVDDLLVCLYPTYPQRKSDDIAHAIEFLKYHHTRSLLCKKEHRGISPYLLMMPTKCHYGKQIIKHNLYRRQDYPPVFEISHFIIIIEVGELPFLNLNLYNKNTVFMPISDVVDVDYEADFIKFNNAKTQE